VDLMLGAWAVWHPALALHLLAYRRG
jgi:hypothetical protein